MLAGHRHNHYLSMMNYDAIVKYYEKLFGRENVSVLLYEQMCREPEAFALQLSGLLGSSMVDVMSLLGAARENAGPSQAYRRVSRFIPQVFMKRRDDQSFGKYEDELKALFAPGNAALAKRHKLPLEQYGYEV